MERGAKVAASIGQEKGGGGALVEETSGLIYGHKALRILSQMSCVNRVLTLAHHNSLS